MSPHSHGADPSVASDEHPAAVQPYEVFWRDHQQWLKECGYLLRPRYDPEWKPSWEGTNKKVSECEDSVEIRHPYVLDATRISDKSPVSLKRISKELHPHEAEIAQFLTSGPLLSDHKNHCVPIYEVFHDPKDDDTIILVMPLLRRYNEPSFRTVGEAVEFFSQMIDGLEFMHRHNVAHRDIFDLNVMMDLVMFPELFHPMIFWMKPDLSGKAKYSSRTERPPKYYYTDFGLSRKYNPADGPPLEIPIMGGDRTVPEFQNEGEDTASNPFFTDIYYLGNLIREGFLQRYIRLDFMDDLVAEMVKDDPQGRPTINEVATRFAAIRSGLTQWQLRGLLRRRDEGRVSIFVKEFRHALRTAYYILKRLPPIPTPS